MNGWMVVSWDIEVSQSVAVSVLQDQRVHWSRFSLIKRGYVTAIFIKKIH